MKITANRILPFVLLDKNAQYLIHRIASKTLHYHFKQPQILVLTLQIELHMRTSEISLPSSLFHHIQMFCRRLIMINFQTKSTP